MHCAHRASQMLYLVLLSRALGLCAGVRTGSARWRKHLTIFLRCAIAQSQAHAEACADAHLPLLQSTKAQCGRQA